MSSDSPAAILFDELGNPVGVQFDGYVYRLQVQGTIVDGYGNGPAAVKPPNTPATTEDPALVVTLSPNNTISVGTVNQGNPNTLPEAWPITITDGYGNIQGSSANPLVVSAEVVFPPGQAVTVDGYVQTNPNVIVENFPSIQTVVVDGYVQTNPDVYVQNFPTSFIVSAVDGYVETNPNVIVSNFPIDQLVIQGTSPWIVSDPQLDGYLADILANQTNGTQVVTIDGYVQTNPDVFVTNFPTDQVISGTVAVSNFPTIQEVSQGTTPWIVVDGVADGYLADILANQTNGTQQVIVDGYVETNPNVNVISFPNDVHVEIDGYVQTNPDVFVTNFPATQIVQEVRSSVSNITSVAASITSVILLSANVNRLGATVWNDSSTNTLYLKLGTTASTSSYTAQVLPSGYYEVPFGYVGEIDGIWSGAVGAARISELS